MILKNPFGVVLNDTIMKILVTGSEGQLGNELRDIFEIQAPGSVVCVDRAELDITDPVAVKSFLTTNEFTHIINCAAYTAVDRAEEEKLECAAINIQGIENLASLADELDIKILHISTDYIFDGNASHPYTESSKPNPLSVYGTTKRKGETALLALAPQSIIIRTGWLYSPYGHNFLKTILARAKEGNQLRVVSDQIGTPTYAADLAQIIATIIFNGQWLAGIYNFSNEGVASWYDFAVAILEEAGYSADSDIILPITTTDYPTAASRPAFSVLDKSKIKATFGINIPHWHSSLRQCIKRLSNITNG